MDRARPPAPSPRATSSAALAVVIAVAIGAALRIWTAASRSLWLDEFHSLHHALAPDLGAVLGGLFVDNHPPASFLVLHAWSAAVGDGQIALRLPAVCYSVLAIWLAARTARHLAPDSPVAGPVAAAVAAASGLAVLLGAEIRMYALLALCAIGLAESVAAWCAAREDGSDGASLPWRATLFVAVGAHAHYWFVHHLALFGLAALTAAGLRAGPRWRARDVAPLALGVTLALPWYLTGFREQLTGHDLWPGGSGVDAAQLAQSYLVLLFVNLGLLPVWAKVVLAGAGAALLAVGALGASTALTRPRGPRSAAWLAIGATAFLLAPFGAAATLAFPRSGFNWNYLAGAVPALAVAIGLGTARLGQRTGALVVAPLLVALLAGAITQASSPGTEDLRGAVRHVLATAEPGDAVLPVEWQPPFFPHGQAWGYYGPRAGSEAGTVPPADLVRLEHGEHYELATLPSPAPPRVHVVRRGLPLDAPLLETLRRRYAREEAVQFGYGVSVQTFSDPR